MRLVKELEPVGKTVATVTGKTRAESVLQFMLGDQKFYGDRNVFCVEDFLEILDITFSCNDFGAWNAGKGKREQAKVLILRMYVSGETKQFMLNLAADKKSTFASASTALKWRLSTCYDDMGKWATRPGALVTYYSRASIQAGHRAVDPHSYREYAYNNMWPAPICLQSS